MDEALQKSGGLYYHKRVGRERRDVLVAAIVVIGIRSFFLQPFIIPTNSMYPSFYGCNLMFTGISGNLILPNRQLTRFCEGFSFRVEAESSGLPLPDLHQKQNSKEFQVLEVGEVQFLSRRKILYLSDFGEECF